MNAQLHISHLRLGLALAAVSSVAAAVGAAPAFAASTRYAAPAAAGTHNCSSRANACSIFTAVGGASAGEEVILEPGDYGTSGSPLTTGIVAMAPDVDIHGVGKRGAPRAVIYSVAAYGMQVGGEGSKLSDVEIDDTGTSAGAALAFDGAVAERLIVIAGPTEGWGCDLNLGAVLRDSVCEQEGSGNAIGIDGVLDGPSRVGLRNDTAISAGGVGIYVASTAGRTSAVRMTNTIARGGHYDLEAFDGGSAATITTTHSNYGVSEKLNGATITDDGTSQTSVVQPLSQLFVDPAAGNFREAIGAKTIAAGLTSSANGSVDFWGDRRKALGHACQTTDIGADEFEPAGPPTVATTGARKVTGKRAIVSGTADPLGGTEVVFFQYGQRGPYGGGPRQHLSTIARCVKPTDSPVPVKAKLTGLRPGTTYYYRVVAANATGETMPVFSGRFRTRGRRP